jgi:hypothetical protein
LKIATHVLPLLLAAALSACQSTPAIQTQKTVESIGLLPEGQAAVHDYILKKDLPLRGVVILERLIAEKKFPAQPAAQYLALLGDEAATERLYVSGRASPQISTVMPLDVQSQDAIAEIVAAAAQHRIVVLNESHTYQRHRAFGHLLANALRTSGFTHLGLEALSPGQGAQVRQRGIKLGDGFYTVDPFFADFTRQARVMGYFVFDYEQRPDQEPPAGATRDEEQNARELAEATNIAAVLKADPNARVMLYVGGGHGLKKMSSTAKFESMAIHLARLTGLEVLSIDQQTGTPTSVSAFESRLRREVEPLVSKTRSTVFRKRTGERLTSAGYDFTVFHPRLPDIESRAGWMGMDGYRKLERIKLAPMNSRTLLRARATPNTENEITYDQITVAAQQTEAALFLPPGNYELFRESEAGSTEKLGRAVVR